MFRLRSVGVLSCAKIFTLIHGAIGVLIGFILLLFGVVGAAIVPGQQKFGMFGMIVAAVLAPLFYAAFGFVAGAMWAWVYNLVAQSIGGLELQLDAVPMPTYAPPSATAGT